MRTARRLLPLATLPLALLLSGCPYESSEPLSPPGEASLDARLFGNWTCRLGEDEKDARVTFLAFDARQYALLWQQKDEEPALLRAHRSELGGLPFLNIQVLDPADRPAERAWSFARYAFEGDQLRFTAIKGETFPKALPPSELRAAVEKRAADPALYEPLAECRKVKDEK
jgi:hypothetical protein